MSRQFIQSAIKEVRDQLMLDNADGEYLNVITSNAGLTRPKLGFSDDTWRALGKALMLSYKQIRTKFEEVLTIVYGPKITQISSLEVPANAGDFSIFVKNVDDIAQIGTVILSQGLANEETRHYYFINRTNNEMFLDEPLTYGHFRYLQDIEKPLLIDGKIGDTTLFVASVDKFPNIFPSTMTVGRGTPSEEVVSLLSKDLIAGSLEITPLVNNHRAVTASSVFSYVDYDYINNTYYLKVQDPKKFPDSGEIHLAEPPTYKVTAGTTATVTVAGGSLIPNVNVGRKVIFLGDLTAALDGVVAEITSNTDNLIQFTPPLPVTPLVGDSFYLIDAFSVTGGTTSTVTLSAPSFTTNALSGDKVMFVDDTGTLLAWNTYTVRENTPTTLTFVETLPLTPASGMSIVVLPVLEYTRVSYDESFLSLKDATYADIPNRMKIELLTRNSLVGLADVKINGAGWDIFETDPRHVEVLIPDNLIDPNTLLSASYLHPKKFDFPGALLTTAAIEDDTVIFADDITGWPVEGVLVADTVRLGYGRVLNNDIITSSTRDTITLLTGGLTPNTLIGEPIIIGTSLWGGTVLSNTVNTITFTEIFPEHVVRVLEGTGAIVAYIPDPYELTILHGGVPTGGFPLGQAITVYEPTYSGTDLIIGNFRNVPDTYPGPYLYQDDLDAPTSVGAPVTLKQALAGPVSLVVSQDSAANTSLEVSDASFFPLNQFPYDAQVGGQSSGTEIVSVTDVNLKQCTRTTLDSPASPGDEVLVTPSRPTTPNCKFPQAMGYRVIIDRGTAAAEIVEIKSTTLTTLVCFPIGKPHAAGALVELLSDTLTVDKLTANHRGYTLAAQRYKVFPEITSTSRNLADLVRVMYKTIDISGGGSIPGESSNIMINFGTQQMTSTAVIQAVGAGVKQIIVNDLTGFPNPIDPYPIVLDPGAYNEETVYVTGAGVAPFTINLQHPTNKLHPAGTKVVRTTGLQETVTYDTNISNVLGFVSPIMVNYNHHINEPIVGSEMKSIPDPDGFGFPFRMPPSLYDQLETLFGLIRAAGVQVSIIKHK